MKQFFTLVCVAAFCVFGYAQQQDLFRNQPANSVVQLDPNISRSDFVSGEILIRYKDEVAVTNLKVSGIAQTGVASIDCIFLKYAVGTSDRLFPGQTRPTQKTMLRGVNGGEFERPGLHNIYKLRIGQPERLFEAIEELNQDPNVLYAEPNYLLSITHHQPVSPVLSDADLITQPFSIFHFPFSIPEVSPSTSAPTPTVATPNDPLYSQQWYIPAIHGDAVWDSVAGGDSTQVIGILDTGVDWLHPDLANKIWINSDEIPDNGIDDDGNGNVDDVRGWDFINNDNNPADDNSHGTHCAGIAAAQANNGIGISGVSPGARIMPIKVFQSSGQGDAATIAQGVTYAATNGATVLSMSFGSYAESQTLKMALANAYATAVLVAAAGNDGLCIGPGPCPDLRPGAPLYPGAYNFVLGVEATKQTPDACGILACFSNFDQDGPVFSSYGELYNYELKAPGQEIISCIPGGSYRVYSGTSMATPLAAGAVAMYRTLRPSESTEMLFGNLINSSSDNLDIEAALQVVPVPVLNIVTYELADTLDGDRDGRVDAGETIEFRVMVRNTWGVTDSVMVGIGFHEFEDTTTANILTREATVGSISAYASLYNEIPLKVQFASGLTDGRQIVFDLSTWYDDHQGEETKQMVISIENGIQLGGIIATNMTLYPDRHYIVNENIVIPQGNTLIIKPGTTLKFGEGISMMVSGSVVALGTKDSLITFTKRDLAGNWGHLETTSTSSLHAAYNIFQNAGNYFGSSYKFAGDVYIKHSIFKYNTGGDIFLVMNALIEQCCIYHNQFSYWGFQSYSEDSLYHNNIIQNVINSWGGAIDIGNSSANLYYNNVFSNMNMQGKQETNISSTTSYGFNILVLDSNYYGTTNTKKINNSIYDFPERGQGIWFDISKKLDRPLRQAHGIVWKIEVNGIDAQDQFEQLDPLGVGEHTFKVYFNRPMDIQYPPMVSMGVRYPYTQTAITTNGSWSTDSTDFTVYGTVGLTTGDGINTIRVTGARDPDHFEIPVEDRRFRVVVNGAGSLSGGFLATPGMQKVTLQWESPAEEISDLLGYNMYRFTLINDTTTSDTLLINSGLITDTVFTDSEVEPGTPYYYAYKTVRTDLSESDLSRVVTAVPFTASTGDANGDLTVNVLDITTLIAYLLDQNPQPFIFQAADVIEDNEINILDVIGIINIITGKKKQVSGLTGTHNDPAYLWLDKEKIRCKSDGQVVALQMELLGQDPDKIRLMMQQKGFELATGMVKGKLMGIVYNLENRALPSGMQELIGIEGRTGPLSWGRVKAGDAEGNDVPVITNHPDPFQVLTCNLTAFPNPFQKSITLAFKLPEPATITVSIFNSTSRLIEVVESSDKKAGDYTLVWNGKRAAPGVYYCRLTGKTKRGEPIKNEIKILLVK